MSGPFANLSASERRETEKREAERFAELRASLTRLVKDEDFRAWFAYIDYELCGGRLGQVEIDAFVQGKRATMDFLRESLAIADGGPAFLADLTRRHFTAIAEARASAQRTKEN